MKTHITAALVTLFALSLGGCGGGSSSPPPQPSPLPVIVSFAAQPSWVSTGQGTTLKWTVSGATGLSIGGIGAVTGDSVAIKPVADTDYVLTASNQTGSTQMHTSVAVYAPPTHWFAPRPNTNDPTYGSVDFLDLFSPTAPWSTAASHIQVLKLYTYVLDTLSDADLTRMFQDLKRRHIALALEWGPLEPNGCGGGEGFDGGPALHYATAIRDHGGSLQYVAFDEPFDFGSLSSDATHVTPCHWTADQIAQDATRHVAILRTIFPDVSVGDIEVVPYVFGAPAWASAPDWLDRYQAWWDAWEKASGAPFAFFHCDVDAGADWRPSVEAVRRSLQHRHIAFGMLYTGIFPSASDAEWSNIVEDYFTGYETQGGTTPDQVVFQSWQSYPKHVLPETDPTTFTHLINRYFRDRTTLASTTTAATIQGGLSKSVDGSPVANAPLSVTAVPRSGTGQSITFTRTGTVPAGTQYITFGIRINDECSWPNPADFYVTRLTMNAGPAGTISADFVNQLADWGWGGQTDLIQVSNATLHVATSGAGSLNMNHFPLAFTAAGAAYTFSVDAMIPIGSKGNGCAIMVFQNASQVEFTRESIPLQPQPEALGTVSTAIDGSFALTLGLAPTVDYELWAQFPGSDTLWPAASAQAIGSAPPVSITTGSLAYGKLGAAYAQTVSAAGGLTPYIWVGTGLPPGLSVSSTGVLSGTPNTAGTYLVAIDVIDDSVPTQVAERDFSVTIN